MAKYKFPKSSKLASKTDFRTVLNYKLFAKNDLMTLYMAPNQAEKARFAASISAKTAPAVVRNRLKRLAREAFRLSQNEIAAGFDYLLIYSPMLSKRSRSDIKKITLNEVRQSFMELAGKGQGLFEKRHNK
jgi:ribonuclease P protein component